MLFRHRRIISLDGGESDYEPIPPSTLSDKDKYSVLKHEVREMDLMANKNMKYFEAHRIALNEEQ
jgi:hypothetical protein